MDDAVPSQPVPGNMVVGLSMQAAVDAMVSESAISFLHRASPHGGLCQNCSNNDPQQLVTTIRDDHGYERFVADSLLEVKCSIMELSTSRHIESWNSGNGYSDLFPN
jgi:hypothetical protein